MGLFKCKMCGAELPVVEGAKIVECEYCGTSQTIATSNDDKILKLYARGNLLRTQNEFDKAYSIFEQIVVENPKDAEAYWNLLLCKYGVTYVDDYDGSKKPTISRMSMTSIKEDVDYKNVIQYADEVTKKVYEKQINDISLIQENILNIVKKEKPYDIFISYKETDEFGDRTIDSVMAQDIYDALTKEGYKVFLSRVTLSGVIGSEYEPYIYSALYSSKVMLLVTTSEEYVNAVWVKNEWSRFLKMMKEDPSKKLIPCFKTIDAYDLPKEVRNIQSVNFDKLGAIQDLIIGVNKILGKQEETPTINVDSQSRINGLIQKGMKMISDGVIDEKEQAGLNRIYEEISDIDCENPYAILFDFLLRLKNDELSKNLLSEIIEKQNNSLNDIVFNFIYKKADLLSKTKFYSLKDYKSFYVSLKSIGESSIFEYVKVLQENSLLLNEELKNKCSELVDIISKNVNDIYISSYNFFKNFNFMESAMNEYTFKNAPYDIVSHLFIYKDIYNLYVSDENKMIPKKIMDIITPHIRNIIIKGKGFGKLFLDYALKMCDISDEEKKRIYGSIYFDVMNVWCGGNAITMKLYYDKVVVNGLGDTRIIPLENILKFNIKLSTYTKNTFTTGATVGQTYWCDLVYKLNDTQYTLIHFGYDLNTSELGHSLPQIYYTFQSWCSLVGIEFGQIEYESGNPFSHNINGLQYIDTIEKFNKKTGCYVATCVYGSYDCKEVWSLRRYRDNYLDSFLLGRLFIKLYYKVSPKLVELFGDKEWFRKPIKKILDRKVKKLKNKGYEDTPYSDKY